MKLLKLTATFGCLENETLESDLSRADDEDFIMELARTQLGLAESGERIFYDVND